MPETIQKAAITLADSKDMHHKTNSRGQYSEYKISLLDNDLNSLMP